MTNALQLVIWPVIWLIHHIAKAAQSGSGVFMEAKLTSLFSYLGEHLIKHIKATK